MSGVCGVLCEIVPHAVGGLGRYLHGNDITTLPDGIFNGLTNLEEM